VARALEILRADVERTLRLLGCPSIAALDPSYIDTPNTGADKLPSNTSEILSFRGMKLSLSF